MVIYRVEAVVRDSFWKDIQYVGTADGSQVWEVPAEEFEALKVSRDPGTKIVVVPRDLGRARLIGYSLD